MNPPAWQKNDKRMYVFPSFNFFFNILVLRKAEMGMHLFILVQKTWKVFLIQIISYYWNLEIKNLKMGENK